MEMTPPFFERCSRALRIWFRVVPLMTNYITVLELELLLFCFSFRSTDSHRFILPDWLSLLFVPFKLFMIYFFFVIPPCICSCSVEVDELMPPEWNPESSWVSSRAGLGRGINISSTSSSSWLRTLAWQEPTSSNISLLDLFRRDLIPLV